MSGHDWGDVLGLLFVLALVMILVRPSSYAPIMVGAVGDAFAKIISFTADSGLSTPVGTTASGVGTGAT